VCRDHRPLGAVVPALGHAVGTVPAARVADAERSAPAPATAVPECAGPRSWRPAARGRGGTRGRCRTRVQRALGSARKDSNLRAGPGRRGDQLAGPHPSSVRSVGRAGRWHVTLRAPVGDNRAAPRRVSSRPSASRLRRLAHRNETNPELGGDLAQRELLAGRHGGRHDGMADFRGDPPTTEAASTGRTSARSSSCLRIHRTSVGEWPER